jgi:hypothetical protein
MPDTPLRPDARVWHPWLRVTRVIQTILRTQWDDGTWPMAKRMLRDAMRERKRLHHAGWFN